MHEEEPRLLIEHVVVDGGHLDPVLPERLQYRGHLLGDQNEVAGNRRLAAAGRLKVDGLPGAHRRWHRHPAILDRFGTGNAELVNAAIVLALSAKGLIDRGSVDIDPLLRGW